MALKTLAFVTALAAMVISNCATASPLTGRGSPSVPAMVEKLSNVTGSTVLQAGQVEALLGLKALGLDKMGAPAVITGRGANRQHTPSDVSAKYTTVPMTLTRRGLRERLYEVDSGVYGSGNQPTLADCEQVCNGQQET
jgi:hypothetical protein